MFLYAQIYWLAEFGDVSCLQFNYPRVETLTPTWEDLVGHLSDNLVGHVSVWSPTTLTVRPECLIVDIKYQSWYLKPSCGLEVQKPIQALKSVKDPGNTFDLNPKWSRTLPSLIYCSWDIYRDSPSIKKIKYQSWYLTLYCGFEVQKPTEAHKSVKDPGNTFALIPKWSRTLPSLICFSWDIYRDPPSIIFFSNIKVDIWHPTVGLRCRNPPRHLSLLKARAIPLT